MKSDISVSRKIEIRQSFQGKGGKLLASWKAIRGKQAASKNRRTVLRSGFDRSVDSGDRSREGGGFRRNAKYLSRIAGISL